MTQEALLTTELGNYTFSLSDADVIVAGTDGGGDPFYSASETKDPIDFGPGAHLHLFTATVVDYDWDGGVLTAANPNRSAPSLGVSSPIQTPATDGHGWFVTTDTPASFDVSQNVVVTGPTVTASFNWGTTQFSAGGGGVGDSWDTEPGASAFIIVKLTTLITSAITG
jgi:hypothetical protein